MNRIGLLFGVAFGFVLVGARLSDYDVIHRMLLFRDWQPFLVLGSAVAVAATSLRLLRRAGWTTPLGGRLRLSPSPVGRHHVVGSLLFGTGWAVAGTCPGPALAMVGSGRLLGLCTVAGLCLGIVLRDAVAARAANRPTPAGVDPLPVGL